jgi:hypothetical protein
MVEDALVNTGAVQWPNPDSAFWAVRRMQVKLHRWATGDPGRRFGDLFNLGNVWPETRGHGHREWIGPRWRGSSPGSGWRASCSRSETS